MQTLRQCSNDGKHRNHWNYGKVTIVSINLGGVFVELLVDDLPTTTAKDSACHGAYKTDEAKAALHNGDGQTHLQVCDSHDSEAATHGRC